MQCVLFAEICLVIAVSSLDFQPKESDSLVGNDTFENINQTEIRPDSVSQFAQVIPLNENGLNKTRQERIQVFRPLFVYRQEQLMKQRLQNKNPDRNTVNKNPKPAAPSPVQPAQNHYAYYNQTPVYYPYPPVPVAPASVPYYPYVAYPPSHLYVNSPSYQYPTYQSYPSYQYPTYSSYPSSSYSSYYSSQPSSAYYPNSYYTEWPSTATGHSNYNYYASKGYPSSSVWPTTSSVASYYAPQAASITYTYPTAWQRK